MEENEKTVSSCCYAETDRRELKDAPIIVRTCLACGQPCALTWPPCPLGICDGSGLTAKTHYDSDSHTYQPDGEELCLCRDTSDHDPDL